MELINTTGYPHQVFRSISMQEDIMLASVGVRVTYNVIGQQCSIASEQQWPFYKQDEETPYGKVFAELVYERGAVDIFALGNAIAPFRKPIEQLEVKINHNNQTLRSLMVFGNRKWVNKLLGMAPTRPEPFINMPMILENAYGGKYDWDGIQIPYMNNPYGKGYYNEKHQAINNPLPNIENPQDLIHTWQAQPDPVGTAFCPIVPMRVQPYVVIKDNEVVEIKKQFYNAAFPGMTVGQVLPGDTFTVWGMHPDHVFSLRIPNHDLQLELKFGEQRHVRPFKIEQVGLLPNDNALFITYRYAFRYQIRPGEQRLLTLLDNNIN